MRKEIDLLRDAVLEDLEITLAKIAYRPVVAIDDANVNVNELGVDLDDLILVRGSKS